jgi:hypothetical protein
VISGDGYPVASQTSLALSPRAAVEAEGAEIYGLAETGWTLKRVIFF